MSELQAALELILKLRNALADADPQRQAVNARLIQDATRFLDQHGADEPRFSG